MRFRSSGPAPTAQRRGRCRFRRRPGGAGARPLRRHLPGRCSGSLRAPPSCTPGPGRTSPPAAPAPRCAAAGPAPRLLTAGAVDGLSQAIGAAVDQPRVGRRRRRCDGPHRGSSRGECRARWRSPRTTWPAVGVDRRGPDPDEHVVGADLAEVGVHGRQDVRGANRSRTITSISAPSFRAAVGVGADTGRPGRRGGRVRGRRGLRPVTARGCGRRRRSGARQRLRA